MPLPPNRLIAAMIGCSAGAASASNYAAPEHKVELQLGIDPAGKIGDCIVTTPSDQPDQDPAACALLQQRGIAQLGNKDPAKVTTMMRWRGGSFTPDALFQPDDPRLKFQPVEGTHWLTIADYPDELLHGASATVTVRFTVAGSGRAVHCDGDAKSGNRALEDWTCRIIEGRRLFRRGQDPSGRPVTYQSASRFFWNPEGIRVCNRGDECGPK